ncbi:MAG: MBOAT family O-acyltransferase, partial [Candidatus Omnitrophota bacterium]
MCYFLANVALTYLAGTAIAKESKHKKTILISTIIWLVSNLCFFKYTNTFLNFLSNVLGGTSFFSKTHLPQILLPLGLSYVIFRLIHYIVELYRKNVAQGTFVEFALYVLFFPTFLAGPVDRFQRFFPQTQGAREFNLTDFNNGLFRFLCGIVKKFFIADNLSRLVLPTLITSQNQPRLFVIAAIYGLAIQIYMDFSGYTDMALGVSRLFGYKIMENFNKPFLQKNIAMFWRNWHISVYSWIRDYFFFPFFGFRASPVKLYAGIFLSMMVFMLWHNANIGFFILGVYHGLGLVVWQLFQEFKARFIKTRANFMKPYAGFLSTFATFSFV